MPEEGKCDLFIIQTRRLTLVMCWILQIKQLEDWFKAAEAIRYSTGQGSIDRTMDHDLGDVGLFEFDIGESQRDMIKSLKKRGAKKLFNNDSLQGKRV